MCVCVCVCERERVCVRESVCVCEGVCVCVIKLSLKQNWPSSTIGVVDSITNDNFRVCINIIVRNTAHPACYHNLIIRDCHVIDV